MSDFPDLSLCFPVLQENFIVEHTPIRCVQSDIRLGGMREEDEAIARASNPHFQLIQWQADALTFPMKAWTSPLNP